MFRTMLYVYCTLYASRMMSHCDDPAGRATIRWNVVRKQMRRETTAEAESVEADLNSGARFNSLLSPDKTVSTKNQLFPIIQQYVSLRISYFLDLDR